MYFKKTGIVFLYTLMVERGCAWLWVSYYDRAFLL